MTPNPYEPPQVAATARVVSAWYVVFIGLACLYAVLPWCGILLFLLTGSLPVYFWLAMLAVVFLMYALDRVFNKGKAEG